MIKKDDYFYTEEHQLHIPKVILAGVDYGDIPDFEHSMEEMKGLIKACDMEVAGVITQSLTHPDNATYLGSGKTMELSEAVSALEAEYVVFEGDLTPSQTKNLGEILKVPVWDRTYLILEIFSKRAKTKEAKLQVELAYLQYMLPRLTGMWAHLGRQGGGGGSRANKGEGEKQIELDRRQINKRIAELSRNLEEITRTRQVQRDGRSKKNTPSVALVGYTNAGKSSLMNRLINNSGGDENKKVFEENMLFATLDTSIRKITGSDNREFLLSDTVGFIENLPHGLIKAFRSTLDEVKYADLLLIVLDAEDPYHPSHKKVTEDTLRELDASNIPRIYVMNKSDKLKEREGLPPEVNEEKIYISAKTGDGINELLNMINRVIRKGEEVLNMLIPYSQGEFLNRIHQNGVVSKEEYAGEGVLVTAECPGYMLDEARKYAI